MSDSLKVFSVCKRCNRPLKNAKSQIVGYGKTCLEKHKQEAEQLLKNGIERGEQGQESLTFYMF